jgi:hypothetical protein
MAIKLDWEYLTKLLVIDDFSDKTGEKNKAPAKKYHHEQSGKDLKQPKQNVQDMEAIKKQEARKAELGEWAALVTKKKPLPTVNLSDNHNNSPLEASFKKAGNNETGEAMGSIVHKKPPSGNSPNPGFKEKIPSISGTGKNRVKTENLWDTDFRGSIGFGDDSGADSFGGSGASSSIAGNSPGKHPFADVNGRALLRKRIQELKSGINEAIEAAAGFPKINSAVVNSLMELKEEVSSLYEIVYMVPVEDVMVRYTLCVQSYDMQTRHLKMIIDDLCPLFVLTPFHSYILYLCMEKPPLFRRPYFLFEGVQQ